MKKLGNVFILGDSYSTFNGYIPEENAVYYCVGANGLEGVEHTWWHILLSKTKSNLVLNDSWSGTTICNTGYNGYCPDISFIGRLDRHIKDGFFEKNPIDTFIVFGGTNDSWANSPIGEIKYEDISDEDVKSVLPASCYLINRIKECVRPENIIVIINSELKEEILSGLKQIAVNNSAICVELKDIEKIEGHPNVLGMSQIAEQTLSVVEKC